MKPTTSILLVMLLVPTVQAKVSVSCNERVRQGPRGTAQALAAFAGCVVLYTVRNELAAAALRKTDSTTDTVKKYASVGGVVSLCAGWIYYFASSARHSFKIFFTDDPSFRSERPSPESTLDRE